jgi:PAS domain S-box-containing protein
MGAMQERNPPLDPTLFRRMAEQVRDYAVFLLDPAGHIVSWGEGARRLKGYDAAEIIGQHFSVFYPPDAVARGWPQEELLRASREGRFEDEGYRIRKDGTRFWANVVITALRDEEGRLLAFSKITRDLTERRLNEEALRQSEERFRLLVEGVVDYAIYLLDPAGVVASWNSGAERIKGYRREEIIGRHFSNFFVEEDVAAGKPWLELAQARREGRVEAQGFRLRKNGERFWARVVVTALYDGAGLLRGFAKITQDLSAQRHVQELQAAARRLNEFIAMLAHEIRNPLAPIQNAAAVMRQAPLGSPVQADMRGIVERQAARLARIADDMIDISRVTRGELRIQRARVHAAGVVTAAVEAARPNIDAGRHRLHVELAEALPPLDGDFDRLVQVFANLLNNAARYTPDGGEIRVWARAEGDEVVFGVRDNGRGIAAEDLPRIFRMFIQGRAPLERIGKGLGVGLALARHIVDLHGGSIAAASEGEGRGAEFIVRLPAGAPAPDAEARSNTAAATAKRRAGGRRVLIVDDNVDAATTLSLLVTALGHEAEVAHDGAAAMRAFEAFRPEVVLLDIGLPGMTGYEVARQLRSRGCDARIIAVTGWGQAEDRLRSEQAGFDMHLIKPVDETKLAEAVEAPERGRTTLH